MADKGAVFVTGASTGIGEHGALGLDKLGYRVFAGVRKQSDGDALKEQASANLHPIIVDVTNEGQVKEAAAEIERTLAGAPLSAVWNNAGISLNGPLEFMPLDELRRQLEVNVVGQVAVTQAVLPMLRQCRGRILITGSVGGFLTTPMVTPYCMSKYAMEAMADGLRRELKRDGIHVVLLEPGSIQSKIWAKGVNDADRFVAAAPPKMMEHYGWLMDAVRNLVPKMEGRAHPPQVVLDRVVHALTSPRPKTRYVMGGNAAVQRWVSRLPDRWQDALVMKLLGA